MTRIALGALLPLALLISAPAWSQESGVAQADAAWCDQPPTVDGVYAEGEWDQATSVDLAYDLIPLGSLMAGALGEATRKQGQLYLMNDAENLYIAVALFDIEAHELFSPETGNVDVNLIFARFDVDGDGVTSLGDDQKVVVTAPDGGAYVDQYRVKDDGDNDHATDAVPNGSGKVMQWPGEGAGGYFYELSMPLDPGDLQDVTARPGDELRGSIVFLEGIRPGRPAEAKVGILLGQPVAQSLGPLSPYGSIFLATEP